MRLLVSLNWFFVGCLTSEDGTEMLYRNVGNKTNNLHHNNVPEELKPDFDDFGS
jgi:hypothetical protein